MPIKSNNIDSIIKYCEATDIRYKHIFDTYKIYKETYLKDDYLYKFSGEIYTPEYYSNNLQKYICRVQEFIVELTNENKSFIFKIEEKIGIYECNLLYKKNGLNFIYSILDKNISIYKEDILFYNDKEKIYLTAIEFFNRCDFAINFISSINET